jgi:hypothetical protein
VRALESPAPVELDDLALLDQVVDYYHRTLKTWREALAYLKKRPGCGGRCGCASFDETAIAPNVGHPSPRSFARLC